MSKLIKGYPAEWISAVEASGRKLDWEGIGQKGKLTVYEYEDGQPGKNSVRFVTDDLCYIRTSRGEVKASGDWLVIYTHGGEHIYTFRLTGGEMQMPERYWHICDTCGKKELLSSREAFERGWKYPGADGDYRDRTQYGFARKVPRMCKSCFASGGRMDGWMQYYNNIRIIFGKESEEEVIKAMGEAQEAINWMEKTKKEREKRVFLEPWSLAADAAVEGAAEEYGMMKLTKWRVGSFEEKNFNLSGYSVSDNAGAFICTSAIEAVEVDRADRKFIFHTSSGSEYVCSFEDIKWQHPGYEKRTKDSLKQLNISEAVVDEALRLARKKEASWVDRLGDELTNGDLYLEMGAGGIIKVYFKYMDVVHLITPYGHTGMFVNSCLYCLPGVVDFRHYEFVGSSVRTYHMSDSIKRLVVNNIGSSPVTIDHKVYESGTTITCITEENHPEWLLSPDVVNGKTVLRNPLKDDIDESDQ